MLSGENIGKFNSSDCLEYRTLANSALHRIWRIKIGFFEGENFGDCRSIAKFANVFSCRFPLYSMSYAFHASHKIVFQKDIRRYGVVECSTIPDAYQRVTKITLSWWIYMCVCWFFQVKLGNSYLFRTAL